VTVLKTPAVRATASPSPARPARRGSRRRKPISDNAAGYLFLIPWLLGILFFVGGPTIVSLFLSFTDFNLLSPPKWVGLENYIEMFTQDPRYFKSLGVTLTYVLVSVPLSLVCALALALLLNTKIKGIGLYRSVYYVPSLLGGSVAIAVLWRQLFGADGIVSHLLQFFGLPASSWISTPSLAIWTLILLHIWQFGSPMIIFLAGLKQVPRDLYEAAAVDGASRWRQFTKITLPLLTPVIFFNLVLQMINAFQAFTPAFVVSSGTGGPSDSTLFYTLYLYQQGFANFRMGYASAMGWVLLIVIGVFSAIAFSSSRYWVYYEDSGK
jgi:multiple sugar transport system permease protein